MRSMLILVCACFSFSFFGTANASDHEEFDQLFSRWTTAFNHKNLAVTCALFANNVSANYRGVPRKNYTSICAGFKKIFHDPRRQYHYQYRLHQVYRSQDLAAVRITWYLKMLEKGKKLVQVQDEGIDVLQRKQGQWQIVNYLAYEV